MLPGDNQSCQVFLFPCLCGQSRNNAAVSSPCCPSGCLCASSIAENGDGKGLAKTLFRLQSWLQCIHPRTDSIVSAGLPGPHALVRGRVSGIVPTEDVGITRKPENTESARVAIYIIFVSDYSPSGKSIWVGYIEARSDVGHRNKQ